MNIGIVEKNEYASQRCGASGSSYTASGDARALEGSRGAGGRWCVGVSLR